MGTGSFLNWKNFMMIYKTFLYSSCNFLMLLLYTFGTRGMKASIETCKKVDSACTPSSPAEPGSHFSQPAPRTACHDCEDAVDWCLSFLMMLWWDKSSEYPVWFLFLLEVNSSGKCTISRCSTGGASTLHIYICINTQTMFVWAAHTHTYTYQIAAFSLMLYDMGVHLYFEFSPPLPHMIRGLPKILLIPVSCWNTGVWEMEVCHKWNC